MKILKSLSLPICIIAGLSLISLCSYADSVRFIQVGAYDEGGEIRLDTDIFLHEFADGRPVKELKIVERNGFLFVSRKGYKDDGACFTELAQLVDRYGIPLVEGADPLAVGRVFFPIDNPLLIVACYDNGCHELAGIEPPDATAPGSASCDITETSDNDCACHFDRGRGIEIVRDISLCEHSIRYIQFRADRWFGGTICENDDDDDTTGSDDSGSEGTICPQASSDE